MEDRELLELFGIKFLLTSIIPVRLLLNDVDWGNRGVVRNSYHYCQQKYARRVSFDEGYNLAHSM